MKTRTKQDTTDKAPKKNQNFGFARVLSAESSTAALPENSRRTNKQRIDARHL